MSLKPFFGLLGSAELVVSCPTRKFFSLYRQDMLALAFLALLGTLLGVQADTLLLSSVVSFLI